MLGILKEILGGHLSGHTLLAVAAVLFSWSD